MMNQTVPIVIGVTGHRDIRPQDVSSLEQAVRDFLLQLKKDYPHSPVRMLNSLAAGADTLCARVALSLSIPLYCPLPMEKTEYRKDFTPEQAEEFDSLYIKAEQVFVSPFTEPEQPERDYLYRQAGIYVAAHCHVLLALWDGAPGKKSGCGTAEAVDFMLKGNYLDRKPFRAGNDGAVLHIATPRVSGQNVFPICATLLENEPGSLARELTQTDRFNAKAAKENPGKTYLLLPEKYLHNSVRNRLQQVYDAADGFSVKCQKQYLKILGLFAVFGVILVLLYLMYDELDLSNCLAGYGIAVGLYALGYLLLTRFHQHENYLQYRSLAEALRIQLYFHALGMPDQVCDDFTWTQKQDATWIKKAVNSLLIGPVPNRDVPWQQIKTAWVEGQLTYHTKAFRRNKAKHKKQQRITRAMVVCTLLTWATVSLLEYAFPVVISSAFWGLSLRTLLKVFWGCLSAVTVFVSGYYGKLSLERKSSDHKKMELLFAQALRQFNETAALQPELFRQLGREELIENGNWVSYCQENTPDFSV